MTWLLVGADRAISDALGHAAEPGDTVIALPDAPQVLRRAWADGVRHVAVYGDDAAFHSIVALMLPLVEESSEPIRGARSVDPFVSDADIGALIVPLGPNGLAQTLGVSRRPEDARKHMTGTVFGPLDICWLRSASETVPMVIGARGKSQRGPARLVAEHRTLKGDRAAPPLDITRARILLANGQYIDGRRVAPRAIPHDGAIDAVVPHLGGWRLRAALRRLERGDRVSADVLSERLFATGTIEGALTLVVDESETIDGPFEMSVERTRLALGV